MSHFGVLIITPNEPTDEEISRLLAPYHEFECTGRNDEYVQSVDIMQETREEYEQSTNRMLKAPDGTLYDCFDDVFYRDPTPEEEEQIGAFPGSAGTSKHISYASQDWDDGKGYRAKVRFVPEGYEEVEVPTSQVKSFREYVEDEWERKPLAVDATPDLDGEHKFGWMRLDANGEVIELVRRTNPNKKWDWWVVGGRVDGCLRPKNPTSGHNCLRKDDVDFEGTRQEYAQAAALRWDTVHAAVDFTGFVPWDSVREQHPDDIEAARADYHKQPAVVALRELTKTNTEYLFLNLEDLMVPREDYIQHAVDHANVWFAYIKDGKWYEKGEMGWWAMVSNEKDDWDKTFNQMLDELPDDCWLTGVDCHI